MSRKRSDTDGSERRLKQRIIRDEVHKERMRLSDKLSMPIKSRSGAKDLIQEWSRLGSHYLSSARGVPRITLICDDCGIKFREKLSFDSFVQENSGKWDEQADPISKLQTVFSDMKEFEVSSKDWKCLKKTIDDWLTTINESIEELKSLEISIDCDACETNSTCCIENVSGDTLNHFTPVTYSMFAIQHTKSSLEPLEGHQNQSESESESEHESSSSDSDDEIAVPNNSENDPDEDDEDYSESSDCDSDDNDD